jgi:hypothetical protein
MISYNGIGRDTQFIGFAKLLVKEMIDVDHNSLDTSDDRALSNLWELIIARRAYDLVSHALSSIGPRELDMLDNVEVVAKVPDMKEWMVEEE